MKQKSSISDNLKKKLQLYIYAYTSFQQTKQLGTFLLTETANDSPHPSPWYIPALAGLVVTYARPFQNNDNLGRLPKSFSSFPNDAKKKELHKNLLNYRNWVCAHTDLFNVPSIISSKTSNLFKCAFKVQDKKMKGLFLAYEQPYLNAKALPQILLLIDYQEKRAYKKATDLLMKEAKGKSYPYNKELIIGEDIP